MTTKIHMDDVMKHMTSFAGQKFSCAEIAEWFGVGDNAMSSLLKQLVMQGRLSSDYVLNSRSKEASYTYPDKTKQIATVAASTRPPRQLSLADRIARERCKELYPEPRCHHEYEHSTIYFPDTPKD